MGPARACFGHMLWTTIFAYGQLTHVHMGTSTCRAFARERVPLSAFAAHRVTHRSTHRHIHANTQTQTCTSTGVRVCFYSQGALSRGAALVKFYWNWAGQPDSSWCLTPLWASTCCLPFATECLLGPCSAQQLWPWHVGVLWRPAIRLGSRAASSSSDCPTYTHPRCNHTIL